MLKIKRIYEKAGKDDGCRILIDRLWPRGLSKEKARIDLWLKNIAPSNDLRKWFNHDPLKWQEFKKKYKDELNNLTKEIELLKNIIEKEKQVTILYSASDKEHNNAMVLKEILKL